MSYTMLRSERVRWIDIVKPTDEDIKALKAECPSLHPLALEDCLSRIERPKLDDYDDHLFLVVQFPIWDATRRMSRPSEVDIFLGAGLLVTVHDGSLRPLTQFHRQMEEQEEFCQQKLTRGASRLFHEVLDKMVDYLLPMVSKTDANIRDIEADIFSEDSKKVIQEISIFRRDILAMRRIIRLQVHTLTQLEHLNKPFIREELDDYFGDIVDHITKVRDLIEENAEIIIGLADTIDTLASVRINEVMRILTVISVIMMPLTLIAGVYGMNVPLPFQRSVASFWLIMFGMLMISVGMLAYFRYRKWL